MIRHFENLLCVCCYRPLPRQLVTSCNVINIINAVSKAKAFYISAVYNLYLDYFDNLHCLELPNCVQMALYIASSDVRLFLFCFLKHQTTNYGDSNTSKRVFSPK